MRADAGVALPGPLVPGQEGAPGRAASADSRCAGLVASAPGAAARRCCGCVLGATPTPLPRGLGRAPLQEPAPEEDRASGGVGVGVAEGAGVRPRGSRSCRVLCGAGRGCDLSRPRQRLARGTLLPWLEPTARSSGSEVQEHTRPPGQARTRGAARGARDPSRPPRPRSPAFTEPGRGPRPGRALARLSFTLCDILTVTSPAVQREN